MPVDCPLNPSQLQELEKTYGTPYQVSVKIDIHF